MTAWFRERTLQSKIALFSEDRSRATVLPTLISSLGTNISVRV